MPHFPKPAEGSWTEHYPHLGTEPVDYSDSTSPEFYEQERDAIFRRTWLNVGRIEQVPRVGSYFTKELDSVGTSIIVVRSAKDKIRVFHNICRHRGNKQAPELFPRTEPFHGNAHAVSGKGGAREDHGNGMVREQPMA